MWTFYASDNAGVAIEIKLEKNDKIFLQCTKKQFLKLNWDHYALMNLMLMEVRRARQQNIFLHIKQRRGRMKKRFV